MAMVGPPTIMPTAKAVISRPARETPTPRSPAISGSSPAMTNSVVPIRNVPAASTHTTNGSLPGAVAAADGIRGRLSLRGARDRCVVRCVSSGLEEGLDGAARVHGLVALGDLLQR